MAALAWVDKVFILKIIGLYSSTKSWINVVSSCFYIIQLIFVIGMALIQFTNMSGDVLQFATHLQATFSYIHMLGKVVIFLKNHEQLTKLLDKKKLFWKTDVCREDIQIKLDNMSNAARQLEILFLSCAVISLIAVILYSLVVGQLPLGIWTFKEYEVLFSMTQTSQILLLVCGPIAIAVFDSIFFGTCVQTIIQFKILCHCLSNLSVSTIISESDENQYYRKLKLYIHQHNFLLGFLKDLQNFYASGFLTELLTIAPVVCAEVYLLLDTNNSTVRIGHSMMLLTELFQLGLYCISAAFVSNEALAVGDAIYNSDWYSDYSPSLGKRMTMLIQKSQQPVIFTAGGLFEINTRTLLTVLRLSWSACTVLRNLKNMNTQ